MKQKKAEMFIVIMIEITAYHNASNGIWPHVGTTFSSQYFGKQSIGHVRFHTLLGPAQCN